MKAFLEILLILAAFLSVIPVVNLSKSRDNKKYRCLKFLIYTAAFWTILIFVERTSSNTSIIYYANMLGFPLKFLLAAFMFCTIFQYIEKKIPKVILVSFLVFFIAELVIALTNSNTLWLLDLSKSNLVVFDDLYTANHGALFIYHLILSYSVLLISITYMFIFLSKNINVRHYRSVTRTMIISVILVLSINLVDFLFLTTNVDLTYISLIFVSHSLYLVIYKNDMIFNLKTSGRTEILSNMREIYILTDKEKRIIEISPLLINKYNIDGESIVGKSFDDLVKLLDNDIVIYKEHNVDVGIDETKEHYHLREKHFKLKGMDSYGFMILLYDETQLYKLLRELNQLSNYDSMTGLNNRNYFENKIQHIKNTKNIGVLSIDINGLKINNDYLGHDRGDYLLKNLAQNLKNVFSNTDKKEIARIGGDEFVVIIYNTNELEIEARKKQILEECFNDKIEDTISVSVGSYICTDGEITIYKIIQLADKAMYEMKEKSSKVYQEKMIEYIKLHDRYIR